MNNARRLSQLRFFRRLSLWEGLSTIILFFIAVPLKYFAGLPIAVKIVGPIHGVLFIGYVIAMILVARSYRWSLGRTALSFGASLIPIGTFLQDPSLKRLEAQDS